MADSAALLDVLIIGAGPAGCATALALRRAGVPRVALVDRLPSPDEAPPTHQWQARWRVESATPDVPGLLARLGVPMPPGTAPYLGSASIWGQPLVIERFARRAWPPGALLERDEFDDHLRRAVGQAGAQVLTGLRLGVVRRDAGIWRVGLCPVRAPDGNQQTLCRSARFLVDASGRRAALATHALGVPRHRWDNQLALQSRLPALAGMSADRLSSVLVEAVPEGWWCAVPAPGRDISLSLMVDADLARGLRVPSNWRGALATSQMWREWLQAPAALPARTGTRAAASGCLAGAAGPGWLAVGDALMSLDPLTSSGLSGALRDGIDAVRQVLLPWLGGAAFDGPGQDWAGRAQRNWQRYRIEARQRYATVDAGAVSPYWLRRQAPTRAASETAG